MNDLSDATVGTKRICILLRLMDVSVKMRMNVSPTKTTANAGYSRLKLIRDYRHLWNQTKERKQCAHNPQQNSTQQRTDNNEIYFIQFDLLVNDDVNVGSGSCASFVDETESSITMRSRSPYLSMHILCE